MYFTLISAKYIGLYSCVFCILQFFYCYVVNVAGAMYILAYPRGGERGMWRPGRPSYAGNEARRFMAIYRSGGKIKIRDHATNGLVYFIAARFYVIF